MDVGIHCIEAAVEYCFRMKEKTEVFSVSFVASIRWLKPEHASCAMDKLEHTVGKGRFP